MTTDELVRDVALEIPDAPSASIRDVLAWSARELCTEADAWVQRKEPVVVAANTAYPQITASQGEPLRIISLTLDGRKRVQGEGFTQPSPTVIEFDRQPDASLIYGELACRPVVGEMPPEDIVSRWGAVMADGARWRLLLLPQSWQNPELATYYQQRFATGIADARQHSRLGHAKGGARVKMRRFI